MRLRYAVIVTIVFGFCCSAVGWPAAPTPLVQAGQTVTWWFVFKFNAAAFPGCGYTVQRACAFGGSVQDYSNFGDQFAYASSDHAALQQGTGCAGETQTDPVGATFDEIYNGSFYFIIWNDQLYDDPVIAGCSKECRSPWGHSKGLLAWDEAGDGLIMQVSTPSWPAAGSAAQPRRSDGNTLGCVSDNNVLVSQHFFALKLNHSDVVQVLSALENASVVTDPTNAQIARNGGPADVQQLVRSLGHKQKGHTALMASLSSGVRLISKPSALHVPPWQFVSAELGGVALRVASWWAAPKIASTTLQSQIGCWDQSLPAPGAVEIA